VIRDPVTTTSATDGASDFAVAFCANAGPDIRPAAPAKAVAPSKLFLIVFSPLRSMARLGGFVAARRCALHAPRHGRSHG
jgi:hypothetical protein